MSSDARLSRRDLLRLGSASALGGLAPGCLPDGRLKRPFHMTPARRDDGLIVGMPSDVGLDPYAVEAAYRRVFDEGALPNVRSLLVMRHGILVAEAYIADAADIDRTGALMSATKSFTSTLAGIALDRGEIDSLDASVGDLFPDKTTDERKRSIRLRDTLTMRAGIDYSNDDFSIDMEYEDVTDSVAHILGKPLSSTPGSDFYYTDACAHLAGALVQRAVGTTLDVYATEHLLSPIGIERFHWLRQDDGLAYGAYGLFLTPRDFLRFGAAMLDAYRGEPGSVVSSAWQREAASFQVHPEHGQGFEYGYLWWIDVDGGGFTASGHGGQFAFSVPELELEVVTTADPNSSEELVSISLTDIRDLVRTLSAGAL